MLRFVALSAIIASASATGFPGYSTSIVHSAWAPKVAVAGPAMGYATAPAAVGFAAAPAAVGFSAAPAAVAVAPVAAVAATHAVIPAAVVSNHIVKHYDVPSSGSIVPSTIDVPANVLPVNFIFRSASSAINVQQAHQGSAGSFKETASQDEPHVLKHTVTKPIIQEVREVISPFRKITQTVEPVREEIQTLVARGVGATQGALLAANMAAKPALMAAAAPVDLAAPVGLAAPAIAAGPAIATMAAPVAAVARPAVAVDNFGTGFAATYDAGLGSAVAMNAGFVGAKVEGFAGPAISTYAKKL